MERRPASARRARTGLNALRTRVRVRGLQAIDRRTAAARALLSWSDDLIGALGGKDTVSPQQRALVDLAVRTKLYVDAVDAWFGSLPGFAKLSTCQPWLTSLSALCGLPLSPEEAERFCRHTGRSAYEAPQGGWKEAVCIVGRQSGKSRVAALVASYAVARFPAGCSQTTPLLRGTTRGCSRSSSAS